MCVCVCVCVCNIQPEGCALLVNRSSCVRSSRILSSHRASTSSSGSTT